MTHNREHVIIHKAKEFLANDKVQKYGGYLVAFALGALIF